MTPTGIRGIGAKSRRTEAIAMHRKAGLSVPRISEMMEEPVWQVEEWIYGKKRKPMGRGRGISPASDAQRVKVKDLPSILPGDGPIDPMHLWPRALGGCDDPLCVVPGARTVHRSFDAGELDILPALIARRYIEEIAHAVLHADGNLLAVLERLTGDQYVARLRDPE